MILISDKPIGVFDSGIGGLTVVREVMNALPNESIVYFGDTARVPYGSKTKETITKYALQIMRYLLTKDVKAVIVACGTVSANCCDTLTSTFDIPVVEMVESGIADACIRATKNKNVGVIGTEATIRSGAYERVIKKADASVKVYSRACPLFVPLAEEGWTDNEVARKTAEIYLDGLKEIDTLILGCTHYPLLINCIQQAAPGVNMLIPAVSAASAMKRCLTENNMHRQSDVPPEISFCVSDNTAKFNRLAQTVLGTGYTAGIINIEDY